MTLAMFGMACIGIYYFLVTKPQQAELSAYEQMLDSIDKHDTIETVGGIIGTVMQIIDKQDSPKLLVIRSDEKSNSRLTIDRRFVRRVVKKKNAKD